MSEDTSELKLANEARTALLNGIVKAAENGQGQEARAFAEAYAIVNTAAPNIPNQSEPGFETGTYRLSTARR